MADKTPKAPDRTALEKEARELRTVLEGLSDVAKLDLSDSKQASAHARLDEVERLLYGLRRQDRAKGAKGAP
jgi:hypothetical protein